MKIQLGVLLFLTIVLLLPPISSGSLGEKHPFFVKKEKKITRAEVIALVELERVAFQKKAESFSFFLEKFEEVFEAFPKLSGLKEFLEKGLEIKRYFSKVDVSLERISFILSEDYETWRRKMLVRKEWKKIRTFQKSMLVLSEKMDEISQQWKVIFYDERR